MNSTEACDIESHVPASFSQGLAYLLEGVSSRCRPRWSPRTGAAVQETPPLGKSLSRCSNPSTSSTKTPDSEAFRSPERLPPADSVAFREVPTLEALQFAAAGAHLVEATPAGAFGRRVSSTPRRRCCWRIAEGPDWCSTGGASGSLPTLHSRSMGNLWRLDLQGASMSRVKRSADVFDEEDSVAEEEEECEETVYLTGCHVSPLLPHDEDLLLEAGGSLASTSARADFEVVDGLTGVTRRFSARSRLEMKMWVTALEDVLLLESSCAKAAAAAVASSAAAATDAEAVADDPRMLEHQEAGGLSPKAAALAPKTCRHGVDGEDEEDVEEDEEACFQEFAEGDTDCPLHGEGGDLAPELFSVRSDEREEIGPVVRPAAAPESPFMSDDMRLAVFSDVTLAPASARRQRLPADAQLNDLWARALQSSPAERAELLRQFYHANATPRLPEQLALMSKLNGRRIEMPEHADEDDVLVGADLIAELDPSIIRPTMCTPTCVAKTADVKL
eukprot:TRINITY_DN46665_c0_g1_i1.p1 TRINITY_DN46665_c0_g1~~TRINITY_DN46665_c0_g1_i1.p1  ORF type:complete len:504 (+),score=116.27 TRINITY_DN46665_c0_g1_i1:110-1621(+)